MPFQKEQIGYPQWHTSHDRFTGCQSFPLIWYSLLTGSVYWHVCTSMMTSSNGNISGVTGQLCGEFTGHRSQRPVTRSACAWINGWVNNGEAGDLRRHRSHYDFIVMSTSIIMTFINEYSVVHAQHTIEKGMSNYMPQALCTDKSAKCAAIN